MTTVELKKLFGEYTIARLPVLTPIPYWCDGEGFVNISRGEDELSVICLRERVPAGVTSEGAWACFKVLDPFVSGETGVLSVVTPVSENGIGVLAVSTLNGNYFLVRSRDAAVAVDALSAAGHRVA
ncbi:ACT domain-containing protein [Rhizobium calliandrae]|uniref:ACT domain-containing protein n=1 Tax=Rhizobium calliandrae TaxID=1312182 RepID=A0ABT7KM67_9HYPH|nr:ACT domain-containing protein [Rhizobium calliandrae]MDL2409725.1 ACT domain-containing protein [Rhizobium calliandrae]